MRTLTIKAIPDKLYRQLKRSAVRHRRSINSEVIVCLEKSLQATAIEPESFLRSVDALRERLQLPTLTDDFLRSAREAGRR